MADPVISLDTTYTTVQPGGQARLTVTVSNPGTVVEGYWLQVLGGPGQWAEVVPPELSVYPQQEATATVIFSPPSGNAAPSGVHAFGVMAMSTVDQTATRVAEGDVEIGEVHGLQGKIIPVTSAGRWRGRHVIQLTNWGNSTAQLRMTASDPDDQLGFYLRPTFLSVPPGGKATVRMSARTKHPFLRGSAVRLPFQVVGEPLNGAAQTAPPAAGMGYGDPSRPVIDGAVNQKPILSKGVITLLTLLLAGVVALGGYVAFLRSQASAKEELAARGSPPKPGGLSVTGAGPDSVGLAWAPVELADGYKLQHIDQQTTNISKVEALDGALTSTVVQGLKPDTAICFRLSATRGGLTGPLSDQVCTRTAPPPASPSPTPSASSASPSASASDGASASPSGGTPGDPNTDPVMRQKWIVVVAEFPKSINVEAAARLKVAQLTGLGLQARYLDTQFYPRLVGAAPAALPTPAPEPEWLVFVGTEFLTQAEAEATCPAIRSRTGEEPCVAVQPDPPQ